MDKYYKGLKIVVYKKDINRDKSWKEDIKMLANRKIVIIGTGHVGSHCAYALAIQGICDEIVLVDKDRTKAKSHSMDIADSVSFFNSSVIVRCGDYSD